MSDIPDIHRCAMELAELADMRDPESQDVNRLRYLAFKVERFAAQELQYLDIEPTRSVLYRSAASLAFQCREFEQAIELIKVGLAGNPPAEIRAELEELMGQVNKAMEGYQ